VELNADTCYRALLAGDTRFDGVFFVGVATTGIYCRPVCPAKKPRPENCAFYRSAAAAERAGFRPCLRCRPELAPGNARVDAAGRLAAAAMSRIEDGALGELKVEELAAELGVTGRHLRRVVEGEFGVSPIALAQTQRLLLGKRLLTDTRLPVTEVAFACGFASLRRFNALFKDRYRLSPTQLRKGCAADPLPETLTCEVAYRPPLDWPALLAFLVGRAASGVEVVEGDRYLRTVAFGKHRGWLAVQPAPGRRALRLELSASLAPVLLPVTARVKRLFDLAANPETIAAHLGPLAAARPGLRVPGAFDGFEMAVRAILGQQVSVKAASTLAARFAAAFGEPVITPFPALTHLSPAPERVAAAEPAAIAALGIVRARADALLALARAVTAGRIRLEPAGDVQPALAELRRLPGIGEWTAQYIAMRALGWPDAFPHTDLGLRKALGEANPKRILAMAEAWRPWRAYAAMHLWKSLETQP
jgi:AraC family transcriptional regulator, regulatory protein of adaptative response / DNA-3-methyladenine glycosylase II